MFQFIYSQKNTGNWASGLREVITKSWFSTPRAYFANLAGGVASAAITFCYFVGLQVVCHIAFLLYNRSLLEQPSSYWLKQIIYHGLPLRLSIAGYAIIPFAVLVGIAPLLEKKVQSIWVNIGLVLITIISLLEVSDLEMYRVWGVHAHFTVLFFLAHPVEAAASVASGPWYWLVIGFVLVTLVSGIGFWQLSKYLVCKWLPSSGQGAASFVASAIIAITALIIARGGFQLSPINQSSAFFSQYPRVNQAAVSPTWNLMQSTLEFAAQDYSRYRHLTDAEAVGHVNDFAPSTGDDVPTNWVTVGHPNVLIIIWESLTSKVVANLGGLKGVTPYLNAEADSGLLFKRCLATGDRTEKGLLSLMTGFPAQPTVSATIYPDVTAKFPHLSTSFNQAGYSTHFLYGGELEFANLRSLLSNGEFEHLEGKEVFAEADQNSKWGAHDHVMFSRLVTTLDTLDKPFFSTALTLSSHEPFEVPGVVNKPGTHQDTLFVRSHRYTDRSLGRFLAQARTRSWWDSTLVLIVGDHGHSQPGHTAAHVQAKYAIPMLVTGGAIKAKGWHIDYPVSQMDAGPLLLALAGVKSHKPFEFARNPLSKDYQPRGLYSFSDGIALVTPSDTLAIDNLDGRILNRRRKSYKGKLRPVALAHLQEITKVMAR